LLLGEIPGLKKRFRAESTDAEQARLSASSVSPLLSPQLLATEDRSNDQFIFDRRRDISKLFGCNTRNVRYRWSLFARRLGDLRLRFPEPKAIDFGAGSLRDSYELARLGFRVVSVDLDANLLQRYSEFYDWERVQTPPQLFAHPLSDLINEM